MRLIYRPVVELGRVEVDPVSAARGVLVGWGKLERTASASVPSPRMNVSSPPVFPGGPAAFPCVVSCWLCGRRPCGRQPAPTNGTPPIESRRFSPSRLQGAYTGAYIDFGDREDSRDPGRHRGFRAVSSASTRPSWRFRATGAKQAFPERGGEHRQRSTARFRWCSGRRGTGPTANKATRRSTRPISSTWRASSPDAMGRLHRPVGRRRQGPGQVRCSSRCATR